jgi:hypothetical protein
VLRWAVDRHRELARNRVAAPAGVELEEPRHGSRRRLPGWRPRR